MFILDISSDCLVDLRGDHVGLLNVTDNAWKDAGFLETRIVPEMRDTFHIALRESRKTGSRVKLMTQVIVDGGDVVPVMMTAFTEADENTAKPRWLRGAIIETSDGALGLDASASDVADAVFSRTVNQIAQSVNGLASFGEQLVRHLATQGDDIGSEYALGVRDATADLEALANLLRPMLNSLTADPEMAAKTLARLDRTFGRNA